jgi:hypothetical protein
MMMKQYRHGDLLITPATKKPKGKMKKTKQSKERVLAYGEVTGHAHRLDKGAKVEIAETGDAYFSVEKSARLTHEEHGPIVFKAGLYRVVRQREYTPEGSRTVAD